MHLPRTRILHALTALTLAALAACSSDASVADDASPEGGSPSPLPSGESPADPAPDAGSTFIPRDEPVTPSDPPIGDPDTFAAGEVDVETVIDTTDNTQRKRISHLIYGINSFNVGSIAPDVMASVTFVRRGGDRVNTYNWETNLSTSSTEQGTQDSDHTLVEHLPVGQRSTPAILDIDMITKDRAAGVGSMIPFVLNDYVASVEQYNLPWKSWTAALGQRDTFFNHVVPVKPTAFGATPDLADDNVYSDEHFAYLKTKIADDLYAPGATQVIVGIDNEPDLYADNYPYLQAGAGATLRAPGTNNAVGKVVDGIEFTNTKFLPFAKRIKQLDPKVEIVGPSHYHYDGYTNWEEKMPQFNDTNWFMEHFLDLVKAESDRVGTRLLDIWDMHWYPQGELGGQLVEYLEAPMSAAQVDAVVQGPRAYWDHDYDEGSWVSYHTGGPTYILERIQTRLAAHYPGTPVGVSEYFPGGCGHIASGLGVADSLGIFARMGVGLAAMWPDCTGNATQKLRYAYGAFKLLRNADGNKLHFSDIVVKVTHPVTDKAVTSVYAGSDDKKSMTVLVINKKTTARKVGLRAFHSAKLGTVDAYRIDADHPTPHLAAQATLAKLNAYAYEAPPLSATLLVFKAP